MSPGRPSPFVRWLARAACRVFYRIDRVGAPPASAATLLLPNHPNALLDPALVWSTAGRDVRFLAKSTLFDGPLRVLVRGAGAIPVYRRLDQADVSKNTDTFAAVDAALAAGGAVCLFPEGISHSSGRLEPLRTGAARMALSAQAAGVDVALVAVGINFDRKTAFRSRVTIVYGPPFSCADLTGAPDAVRALTERIAAHMRTLLVEADPESDARLVARVDALYAAARRLPREGAEGVARRRIIAAGIERLRASDPARYDQLLLRFRRYDQRLRRFGLRDRHLDWQVTTDDAVRFALREAEIALVAAPVALAALALFFVPYHLTAAAARWFTRDADVKATAKVVAGLVIYAAWWAALTIAAWNVGGSTAALATAVLLPILAVAGLFAIERESAVLETIRAWFLLRRAREGTRARLRKHRSELADIMDQVHGWQEEAQNAD